MHVCISKLTISVSENDLSPDQCQAIIWTNARILSIGPLGTNFSEILFEIYIFSAWLLHFKMSSANWWLFCLSLNELSAVWKVQCFFPVSSVVINFISWWWTPNFHPKGQKSPLNSLRPSDTCIYICISKLATIGSDNGLSPGGRQAIIWTNDGMMLVQTLGTNFSEILSENHAFSFKKIHFKMSWKQYFLNEMC